MDNLSLKKCTRCNEQKPTSEFYKRGSGLYSECKICKRSKRRILYQEQSATNSNSMIHQFTKVADIIFENELSRLSDVSVELERKLKQWQSRKEITRP
nr:hypothetical protein HAGR004_37900 [Bdellovibrio sp. HAGR004]